MKSMSKLYVNLEAEEKQKLVDAAEVFEEIMAHLIMNKDNGFTPFQDGLEICDEFWDIYYMCRNIEADELIP